MNGTSASFPCSFKSKQKTQSSLSVRSAKAGGEHSLLQTKNGHLLSAGACGLGWCRLDSDPNPFLSTTSSLFQWRDVPIPEPSKLFHAGYYHNLAVGSISGSLYSWGCGTFTEGGMDGVIPALGHSHDKGEDSDRGGKPETVPIPNIANDPIIDVAGGAYHSVILQQSGRVTTFGAAQLGQLGRKPNLTDRSGLPVDPQPLPADIKLADSSPGKEKAKVTKVGAGFYNTFAICNMGKLYCAGENQNKQCGSGPINLSTLSEVKEVSVSDSSAHDIAQVSGGYCHTLVRTSTGEVLTMGCGDDGQRGDGRPGDVEDRNIATAIQLPGEGVKATSIAAGANHSVVLGSNGIAYTFGANDVGQCGIGKEGASSRMAENHDDDDEEEEDDDGDTSILSPKPVSLPVTSNNKQDQVVEISAGYAHTVLRTESGAVYTFGQNTNGQLGLGQEAAKLNDCEFEPIPVSVLYSMD